MGCIHSKSDYPLSTNASYLNHYEQGLKHSNAAIYHALPTEYQRHKVVKVYDGDTLTIEGNRRVRFLGIDCPELDEKQPFAEEAKDYVLRKCHDKHVYFSFEPGNDKTDRYGRLLAWVWVDLQEDGSLSSTGYLNVNEALISEGLANIYTPGNKKLQNHAKLIALQSKARENKLGKWKTFKDVYVYKTRNGKAFHKQGCKHLAKSVKLEKILASKGTDEGLHPCRTCLSDM